jgi:hypothetical protein
VAKVGTHVALAAVAAALAGCGGSGQPAGGAVVVNDTTKSVHLIEASVVSDPYSPTGPGSCVGTDGRCPFVYAQATVEPGTRATFKLLDPKKPDADEPLEGLFIGKVQGGRCVILPPETGAKTFLFNVSQLETLKNAC